MAFLDIPIYDIPELSDEDILIIRKEILVFVGEANYSNDEASLLTKILGAAQKQMDQVQIIQLPDGHSKGINWESAESCLVLLFGIAPIQIGLQIDAGYYRPKKVWAHTVIRSHSLDYLPKNVDAKRALWQSLKSHFNI